MFFSSKVFVYELTTNITVLSSRGLQYLHTFKKKPLIHGDIKPANILLDPCNQPKIGDFGLAREGALNSPMEVSRVYGTKPYLPAEFLENHTLSTKVDTFSFGVVLFELATGLRAYDRSREKAFLTKHIKSFHETAQRNLRAVLDQLADKTPEKAKEAEAILMKGLANQLMDKTLEKSNLTESMFTDLLLLGLYCTNEKACDRPEMVTVLTYLAKCHAEKKGE